MLNILIAQRYDIFILSLPYILPFLLFTMPDLTFQGYPDPSLKTRLWIHDGNTFQEVYIIQAVRTRASFR